MPQATQVKKLNVKPTIEKTLGVLSDRNSTILARRHGIGTSGERQTLEKIGSDYNITRERVRQIEEASYLKIRNSAEYEFLAPAFEEINNYLNEHCGVVSEEVLVETLASDAHRPYLSLLLALNDSFIKIKEGDDFQASWAVTKESAEKVKAFLTGIVKSMEKTGEPIDAEELMVMAKEANKDSLPVTEDNLHILLGVSKKVELGPFNQWGLAEWPQITPRGVRDKVFLVLHRHGEPLHFRELARRIDDAPFRFKNSKKTHPQTVHNELIKDERFVLIGRGIYALANWGYMPGTVKDVIMNILKEEGKPVEREVLVDRVMDQRKVQKNTILLNLQNRTHFKKDEGNKYYLA